MRARMHLTGSWIAVALLALAPAAAAKPRRADLTVAKLARGPATVLPGATLELSATVRNRGHARARASTLAGYLSTDARRSAHDLRLTGGPRLRALKPGRHAAGTRSVRVPAATPPGLYRLLACADGAGKVRESNEKNNCRAAAGSVRVAAADAVQPGGGNPAPAPTPTPTPTPPAGAFPKTPNPLKVGAETLDTAHATSRSPFSGGSLVTYGADGTKYTLSVPFGALPSPIDITMTPVTSVAGLPFSKGLIGAVHLEPHGLQLLKPATLTIEPTTAPPVAEQTGFLFQEGGDDTHLAPLTSASTITLPLTHFSTPGAAAATSADIANVQAHAPARTQAQLEQALAEIMRAQREQALGQPVPPGSTEGAGKVFSDYYDDVVLPSLTAAESDDAQAASAVAGALGWARMVEVLGASTDPALKSREDDMWSAIEAVLVNAVDKGYARCKDHDLTQITRLMAFERTALILGFSLGAFDKALRCAHFQVSFDAEITSSESNVLIGGGGHEDLSGDWRRAATKVPVDIGGSASAPLPSVTFSFNRYQHTSCAPNPGEYTTQETSASADPITVSLNLFLDLNYRETPPAGQPAPQPRRNFVLFSFGGTGLFDAEHYNRTSTACGGAVTDTTLTNFDWYSLLEGFHANAGQLRVDLTSPPANDLLAGEVIQHSDTVGGRTDHEYTTVEVWHTPQ